MYSGLQRQIRLLISLKTEKSQNLLSGNPWQLDNACEDYCTYSKHTRLETKKSESKQKRKHRKRGLKTKTEFAGSILSKPVEPRNKALNRVHSFLNKW